jgi:hypothetical protein
MLSDATNLARRQSQGPNCQSPSCEPTEAAPSLEEAYAMFAAERSRLVATTKAADCIIAAALAQLQQTPAITTSPAAAAWSGGARSLDAAKLSSRNAALANRLQAALAASQAVKEQVRPPAPEALSTVQPAAVHPPLANQPTRLICPAALPHPEPLCCMCPAARAAGRAAIHGEQQQGQP